MHVPLQVPSKDHQNWNNMFFFWGHYAPCSPHRNIWPARKQEQIYRCQMSPDSSRCHLSVTHLCWSAITMGIRVYTAVSLSVDENKEKSDEQTCNKSLKRNQMRSIN